MRTNGVKSLMIQWTANDNYALSNNDTKIVKTGIDSWNDELFSRFPIASRITYFQMKINYLCRYGFEGGGIAFGITKNKDIDFPGLYKATCLCNSVNDAMDQHSIKRYDRCEAAAGDVIGVVVDQKQDQTRFYKNGKFVALGIRKPSDMQPMYAVVKLYFEACEVEMGDFYEYKELGPHEQIIAQGDKF